jgi:hypothetical protein
VNDENFLHNLLPERIEFLINRRGVTGQMITSMAFVAGNQAWLLIRRVAAITNSTLGAEPLVAGVHKAGEVHWNF